MDPYSLGASIGQLVGCSCCCLFAVLVIVGVAVLAMRGGKSKADGVEGAPAGPDRGSKATASLTRMEANASPESSDADGATVVLTRPSQPSPPSSAASAPALAIPKPVAAPPPVPKPVAAPPPVPRPAVPPPVPAAAPKPPVVPTAGPTFLGGTVIDDGAARPPRPGPANFVPGRTIVVDDEDEVPMPPPPKKV